MESEELRVRLITSEKEYNSILIKATIGEQWWPGLQDARFHLTCDPTGAFVGELDGKAIGVVTLTKYGDSFGFVGNFLVNKEYRGKGYGRKILDTALASVKPSRNLGLVSVPDRKTMFERRGFREHFKVVHVEFHLPTSLTCFSEVSKKPHAKIGCVDLVGEKALLDYDTCVFGFPRHASLAKWLRVQGSHARVAIDEEGAVTGFVAARATFAKEEGYRIGPLFADSESIAEELLKSMFEEILQQNYRPPFARTTILVQDAMALAEKLKGKIVFDDLTYMTTKGLPNASFGKWFALTGYELA